MGVPSTIIPHQRVAFKPITEAGGDEDIHASKFGGIPLVPSGGDWPTCANCGRPMQLFVQLLAGDLPRGAPFFGEGMLQLFYCTSSNPVCEVDCEAYAPHAQSVLARLIDTHGAVAPAARHQGISRARRITGWESIADYPNGEELDALGVELEDDEIDSVGEQFPRDGDKLGGWPLWIQGVEYPECTECGEQMANILQLDSEDNVPHMFGDAGVGHLSQCSKPRNVMSFHWACC
jgi:uncharacterized protein YwqG